ncbi:unnamed protein product, partial [Closterium sp. NIES-53]
VFPVPLLPSVASAADVDLVGTAEVGAASAPSGRRRKSKGKVGKGGGGDGGGGGGGGGGGRGGGGGGGGGGGSGGFGGGGWGGRCSGSGGGGSGSGGGGGGSGGAGRGGAASGGVGPCTYVLRTGGRRGETCGLPHTAQHCFARLTDAWRTQFPDAVELPRSGDLLKQNVAIFDLDFDAILAAMYAVTDSAEGDCYLCVPPDLGIEAAALGASVSAAPSTSESAALGAGESALSGIAPIEALHTFTLDSSASRFFFRDSTTLTPLSRPVAVSLTDPSGGPVLAHSSTVLPYPAAPSGLLSGLQLPSFSTKLVSGADLQDLWVDQFTPGGSRVWSGVFAAARPSPVSAPSSCRPLSHETLLWHHRLGHPSLPGLRGMASHTLVSGLPRSLPPLPPGPAPTCVPCVEGPQRAAPHSFEFPPTEAPPQTLHMDVWGPARIRGQGHEHYFLLVVDDYSRYTTVFPLRRKGEVTEVLIDWIRGARRLLRESFGSDLPVLRLHSDRGGEFSSDLLRAFCRAEGIHQTFTFPASPQQNGIAERCIGMYAAHQINLVPRVSLSETTPTLRWTGKVGDASVFHVYGSRAFFRDASADKLSSHAIPCIFLGFPPDAPGWQFYHPTSRRVLSSQDITFDESGAEPGGAEPERVEPGGAEPERVEPEGAEPGGAESGGAEPGGAEPERAESGGPAGVPSWREPLSPQQLREWYARRCRRAAGAAGGASGAAGAAAGAGAAGGAAGAASLGGAGAGGTGTVGGPASVGAGGGAGATVVGAGAVATGGSAGAGAVGGTGAGGAVGVVAGDPGAEVLGLPPSGPPPPLLSPLPVQSPSQLQPVSPLPGPSPYFGPTRGLTERREPQSRPASPESRPVSPESRPESPVGLVRTSRCVPRQSPPPVSGTHSMTLRPSTAPQRVPLLSPLASSLPDGPDLESESLRAASPIVTRFLATAVTVPSFESTAASALIAELVDFAAACRLDYATSLVAEFECASVYPPSVGGECALGTDILEDRKEEFECFAAVVPHLVSMRLAPEGDLDAPDIPNPRSYAKAIEGTYIDKVPPHGVNIVSGMWIFKVKRPPGSPPVFKARYVARGFRQRQGVDFFQTFSPTPKMTTLWVLLHVAAQRDYELHLLDFSTAFLQGSLHEEIWLRRPPDFTGSFPAGTQ